MTDTLTKAPRVKMANEATLRDYFAARASDGDIKYHSQDPKHPFPTCSREQAKYRYADAMLAAREETK